MPKARSVAPVGQNSISKCTTRLLCSAAFALAGIGTAASQEMINITTPETLEEAIVLDGDGDTLNITDNGSITVNDGSVSNVVTVTGRNSTITIGSGNSITHEHPIGTGIQLSQDDQGTGAVEDGTVIINSGMIEGQFKAIGIADNNLEDVKIINRGGGSINAGANSSFAIVGVASSLGDEAGVITVINEQGEIGAISMGINQALAQNGVDENGQPVAEHTFDDDGNFVSSTATIEGREDGVILLGTQSRVFNHGAIIGLTGSGVTIGEGVEPVFLSNGERQVPREETDAIVENHGWIIGEQGVLANTGDNKTITNTGTIVGVEITGERTLFTNSGRIQGSTNGVETRGGRLEFNNSGTITGGLIGLYMPVFPNGFSVSQIARITNEAGGEIIGEAEAGVDLAVSTLSVLTNHGRIAGATAGININALGQGLTIDNHHEISGTGSGLTFRGVGNTLNNLDGGSIVSAAGAGVVQDLDNITTIGLGNSVTNSGLIEGLDVAILVTNAGTSNFLSITNSGTLKTTSSLDGNQYIIRDLGVADVSLTLNEGTQLLHGSDTGGQAMFDLGGGENSVTIATGLSTDILFVVGARTDEAGEQLAESTQPTINADSGIVLEEIVSDSSLRVRACSEGCVSVITVDESAVAVPDTQLADLTRGVSSAVSARLSSVRNDGRSQNVEGFSANGADGDWLDHRFWTQAFGSFRQNRGSSTTVGGHQQLGGMMFGADEQVSNGTLGDFRGGLFGGFAIASQETSFDTLKQDAHSYFFGGYASMDQD